MYKLCIVGLAPQAKNIPTMYATNLQTTPQCSSRKRRPTDRKKKRILDVLFVFLQRASAQQKVQTCDLTLQRNEFMKAFSFHNNYHFHGIGIII